MGKKVAILFAIILLHIFLLTRINFFPYPELFVYSYLTSKGLLPYKQIFDQHFPGLVFFPINLYSLGVMAPEIVKIFHLILVSISHLLLFKIARKLFKGWVVFLPNLLYLIWQPYFEGYVFWIDSFITPFLLMSFYYLYAQKNTKISYFLSGLLLGAALTAKQVVLPLILLLVLYLFITRAKNILWFLTGVTMPVLFMLLYILKIGVWEDFYYWTITYNLTTFAQMGRKLPTLSLFLRSGMVFFVGAFAWLIEASKNQRKNTILLGIFGFGSLVFTCARFDYIHLQPALPFFLLMISGFIFLLHSRLKIVLGVCYLVFSLILISRFYQALRGNQTYFFGNFEKEVASEVRRLSKPDDGVFAVGTMPHLYYLADRLPPGGVFVFQFPWVMVIVEDKILEGLVLDPPKVVIRNEAASVDNLNLVAFMPKIDEYISKNYIVYKIIEDTEIMIPK